MPRRNPATPRAIAYLRVSTDDQATSGLGLAAQRVSCEAAAARLQLPLAQVVTEGEEDAQGRPRGLSGGLPLEARPALQAAIAALHRGDVLLVAKRDRLGRNVFNVLTIDRVVKQRGARTISAAGEGTDDDSPGGELMRGLMDQFNQYERTVISHRTRAALHVKRLRQERISRWLPYGYALAADGRKLEPRDDEQRTHAWIRQLRADGLTLVAIAATLNAAGSRMRAGTPWTHQRISALSQGLKPCRVPTAEGLGRPTDVSDVRGVA